MSLFSSKYKLIYSEFCRVFKTLPTYQSGVDVLGKSFLVKNYISVLTNNGNVYSVCSKGFGHKGLNENITNGGKKILERKENSAEKDARKCEHKAKSLSCIMKCNETTAYRLLFKFPFLENANMNIINSKVTTLLEAGIDKNELMNDMWILAYSLPKLKEQIQLVQNTHCHPIKPWHLRCKEGIFHSLIQNKENNRLALRPYQSVTDYICQRLGLTENQVHLFAKRHPPVMRVKVAKLKEIIDFLYSEGFTSQQIVNTPRILCHSLKTIQARLDILKANNHKPYSLFVLCKTKSKFNDFVENLRPPET